MIPCSLATCPSTLQHLAAVWGVQLCSYALVVTGRHWSSLAVGLGHFGPGNCFSSFMHLSLASSEARQIEPNRQCPCPIESIVEFRDNLATGVFHKRGDRCRVRFQQEKCQFLRLDPDALTFWCACTNFCKSYRCLISKQHLRWCITEWIPTVSLLIVASTLRNELVQLVGILHKAHRLQNFTLAQFWWLSSATRNTSGGLQFTTPRNGCWLQRSVPPKRSVEQTPGFRASKRMENPVDALSGIVLCTCWSWCTGDLALLLHEIVRQVGKQYRVCARLRHGPVAVTEMESKRNKTPQPLRPAKTLLAANHGIYIIYHTQSTNESLAKGPKPLVTSLHKSPLGSENKGLKNRCWIWVVAGETADMCHGRTTWLAFAPAST